MKNILRKRHFKCSCGHTHQDYVWDSDLDAFAEKCKNPVCKEGLTKTQMYNPETEQNAPGIRTPTKNRV